jgi:regulatory protein
MEKKKHIYTEQEAYQKLSALCAMSEQCCHDVMKKMKRWEVADEVAVRIVARLVKEKFIDEERFARAFVKDKFRYNHWGQVRIEQELKMRKIAPKHIEMGLEELKEEDSLGALREMIQKKRPTVKGKNEYEIRGKLIRFALGRGFAMDDIMKVVGSLDECDEYMD